MRRRPHDPGSIGDGVASRRFEIVFVELVAEGADANAEKFCRVGAITLAAFQGGEDVAFLDFAEAAEFADAAFGGAGGHHPLGGEPPLRRLGDALTAQNHRPLNHISQFPSIAPPTTNLQPPNTPAPTTTNT